MCVAEMQTFSVLKLPQSCKFVEPMTEPFSVHSGLHECLLPIVLSIFGAEVKRNRVQTPSLQISLHDDSYLPTLSWAFLGCGH